MRAPAQRSDPARGADVGRDRRDPCASPLGENGRFKSPIRPPCRVPCGPWGTVQGGARGIGPLAPYAGLHGLGSVSNCGQLANTGGDGT